MQKKRFNSGYNRQAALEKMAEELDLTYTENDEFGLVNLLKDFKLFRVGVDNRQKITHVLSNKSDLSGFNIHIFDYEHGGRSKDVYELQYPNFNQTVFFVQSKKLALSQFYMEPERFFHKVSNFLGISDINFEAFPTFSDQYWLKGKDEEAIRKHMSDKALHFFTIEKYWSLEGLNYYLIFYSKGKVLYGNQLKMLYEKGMEIVNIFSTD